MARALPARQRWTRLRTEQRPKRQTAIFVALLLAGCTFAAGCPARKTPTVNWRFVNQMRPRVPPRPVLIEEPVAPPELQIEPPAPPQLIFVRNSLPPRPHIPAGSGANAGDAGSALPPAPLLSPQLSPEEQSTAQQQTEQSLRIAENNMRTTLGMRLSTTQTELAEKVRSFIAQAREAVRGGDWLRARNLAQKAELLSLDLVKAR